MEKLTMKRLFASVIALAILIVLLAQNSTSAIAGERCNRFDPVPSPLSTQWRPCPDAPNVSDYVSSSNSIGGPSDHYLHVDDQSGGSQECTAPTNPLLGDWSKEAKCAQLCLDVLDIDNYNSVNRKMWVRLTGGTISFGFGFNNPADYLHVDGKWHKYCVPVYTINPGDPLPSTSQGQWIVTSGFSNTPTAADWNAMLSNVTEVRLPADGTSSPTEQIGYDNICVSEGDCPKPLEPVIKTFLKTAKLDCDKITYTIHIETVSDGASSQDIHLSDVWPAGTLAAASINITGNTGIAPVSTVLNATGWNVVVKTGTGSGSIISKYDLTFTVGVDPAAITGGDIKIKNQAKAQIGASGPTQQSETAPGDGGSTVVVVNSDEYKKCHKKDDPPPQTGSCLSGKIDIACGKTPSTYTITLHPVGDGGLIPTSVTIVPPAGVTLIPNSPSYPVVGGALTVTISGATPGQSVVLDVQGVTHGAGSESGTDLCCNGKITIVIPRDLLCDKDTVDIAIKKTGATSPPPDVPAYTFDLAMTNEGHAFTAAPGQVKVTEHVPAGIKFTAIIPTAGWTCAPIAPITGPATVVCTFAGGPLAAGPGTPIGGAHIVAQNMNPAPYAPVENCADIGLAAGGGLTESTLANNKSCVIVAKPKDSDIKVVKICDPAKEVGDMMLHYEAKCHITVTTTGPQTGTIAVNDVLTGTGTVGPVTSTSTPAWTCSGASCSISGASLNQTSSTSTFDATVSFPPASGQSSAKNCAELGLNGTNYGPPSCVDIPVFDPPKFGFDVKKMVVSNLPIPLPPVTFPYSYTCTSGAGASGTITDGEVVHVNGLATGTSCNVTEGAIPTVPGLCPANFSPVWTTSYAPSATVAAGPGALVTITNTLKCIPTETGAGTITINKVCDPAHQNPAGGWEANCHITVTSTGVISGPVNVSEIFTPIATGSAGTVTYTGSSTSDPWTCSPTTAPSATPLNCTLPGNTLNPAGDTSVMDVVVNFHDKGWIQESKNCAAATYGGQPIPQVCVPFTVSVPPSQCDAATTTSEGDKCLCKFDNMSHISASACGCGKGFELAAGKGCVKSGVKAPVIDPPPAGKTCQQGQHINANGRCVSDIPECPDNTRWNGKRCMPDVPECSSGTHWNGKRCMPDVPECKRGTHLEGPRCVSDRPVCERNQRYNPRTNSCIDPPPPPLRCEYGQIKVRDRCVDVPQCRPGTIPLPGTGVCVRVGGDKPREPAPDRPQESGAGRPRPKLPGF